MFAMTRMLPILPLRDIVVFPHRIVPLFVGREKSVAALEAAMADDRELFLVAQLDPGEDDPDRDALYDLGVIATAMQLLKLPDGTVRVLVEGVKRARLVDLVPRDGFVAAEVEEVEEESADGAETQALMRSVIEQFDNYAKLNKRLPPETGIQLSEIEEPSALADAVASNLSIKVADKQALLGELNPARRLEMVFAFMEGELGVLQVEKKIRSRVKRQMEKTQREYYLNEQLKAIQRELGNEGEEGGDELQELAEKIRKTRLSKEARNRANSELKKLRAMAPMSAEATVARNYLDVLLGLPWSKKSKLKKDIPEAQRVLDEDHFALEKVKERIVEYLAVQARTNKLKGPDPLPGRTSRRRQDLARPLDRPGDGPRVRSPVIGRSARRGRNPRSPPHLYRLAARQDHLEHQESRNLEPACSCSTRSTSSARISAATRHRRCSRSSTPSRTTASRTIIWSSTTTFRT